MKPRTLIKNHETAYIRDQLESVRHVFGYVVREDGGVIRKSIHKDANYLVKHGFNRHSEHAWNGASELQ